MSLRQPADAAEARVRAGDIMVIAAWSAVVFGVAQGILLCLMRYAPVLRAPYKLPVAALWAVPLTNLVLFLCAAVPLAVLLRSRSWRSPTMPLRLTYGLFAFLGVLAILVEPGVIHNLAAVVLSLGVTAVLVKRIRGEEQITQRLRRRLVWVPLIVLSLALGTGAAAWGGERWLTSQLPPAAGRAPNVLLLILDSVRRDSFEQDDTTAALTPNLQRILKHAAHYTNAWSTSSWSLPSHASILTGRYPHEHGADWPTLAIREDVPTLAEILSAQGYVTGAFSGNDAWVTPEYMGRGFQRFQVYTFEQLIMRSTYGRVVRGALGRLGLLRGSRGLDAQQLNAGFVKMLDDHEQRPFFAYLCYMDANRAMHQRLLGASWEETPEPQQVYRAYEEGLRRLDADIGNLFAELEARGKLDNTIVVVTSDHGLSFGRNPNQRKPTNHGTSLYPEQVRVPLFMMFPGDSAASKVDQTFSLRDIALRVAAEVGVAEALTDPTQRQLASKSSEDSLLDDPTLLTLHYGGRKMEAVVWGPWQYISSQTDAGRKEELYNLTTDPQATVDLAKSQRDVLRALRTWLAEQMGPADTPSAQGTR